ncbi:MAG: PQQ-binding-like beta-propeller repeat protein [Armatimonadota bacterium]|nr:PQQ-binding-like beta-propeller repeat protein [Armatimonadota bacterium]
MADGWLSGLAGPLQALLGLLVAVTLVPAAADDYVGWRTDGTGEYPDASPVITWSPDENVVWATEMPGSSNSLPIIVGDRLYTCSEPALLLCVDVGSGVIRWQASNEPADVAPPDEVADLEDKTQEFNRLRGELGKVNAELRKVKKQLQDDQSNEDLKAQFRELRQKQQQLQAQIKPLAETWYVRPPAHGYNGYSTPTPISDGQHVWVIYGNGIAACYDMEGNRVWGRFIEKHPHDYGLATTPVMADGKLVVHINHLRALDPATGEEIWAQPEAAWSWGTPWVQEIGGETLIFTCKGDVVRAEDGEIIASGLGKLEWGSEPMVEDGVLYYIDNQGGDAISRAYRLPETAESPFEPELLWEAEPNKNRYYASPIVEDGLIYAVTRHNVLSCLDAETGEIVYEQDLQMGKGDVFASIVLAGDLLFATHENGTTVIFEPGGEFVEVARNQLGDTVRSTPVFDGDRMYVRGYEKLWCIGPDAG